MKANLRTNLNTSSREFFQVSLVTYLLLTLAETIKTGFVSNFFNMNYLLLVVLVTGIIMVLTEPADSPVGRAVAGVTNGAQAAGQAVATVTQTVARAVVRRPASTLDVVQRPTGPRTLDLRERPSVPPGPGDNRPAI